VIDGATDSVITIVATHCGELCYNPTNNKVYCAHYDDDSLTVIDGATDAIVTTIEVGANALAFACNPTQSQVYVAIYDESRIAVLTDTILTGIEEVPKRQTTSSKPLPTIIRGVLVLGAVGSRQNTVDGAELMDACGRKVTDLHAGANDVRALAPGVYFVRDEGRGAGDAGRTSKVVITR
jgi:YVTN family beta-propeller protein